MPSRKIWHFLFLGDYADTIGKMENNGELACSYLQLQIISDYLNDDEKNNYHNTVDCDTQ